eukprot:SAG11_NODE_2893_length_2860_cov_8.281420_2_plen_101_part_00
MAFSHSLDLKPAQTEDTFVWTCLPVKAKKKQKGPHTKKIKKNAQYWGDGYLRAFLSTWYAQLYAESGPKNGEMAVIASRQPRWAVLYGWILSTDPQIPYG